MASIAPRYRVALEVVNRKPEQFEVDISDVSALAVPRTVALLVAEAVSRLWSSPPPEPPPPPAMNRGFFRSTAVVGATTLLSRITGLAREMVFAAIVPAVMLEVYVLANQIPNLLRRLFAEGAFSQAFVPVVAEYRAKRSTEEVRDLVDSVAGTLGAVLAVISILGVIIAPLIGAGVAGYLFKSGILAADDVVPDRGGGGRTEVAPGASAPRKKK